MEDEKPLSGTHDQGQELEIVTHLFKVFQGIPQASRRRIIETVAASAEAERRLLLSEDLEEGFTWRGVTVTNPFAPALPSLLAALLMAPGE